MNMSALAQVEGNWPETLAILALARSRCTQERLPPVSQLARTAAVVLALPAYLQFASPQNRTPPPTPVPVAAAHKMCAGLFGLCKNYLIAHVHQGSDFSEVRASSAALFRYAESEDALLSRTGIEACAGPPQLMVQALRVLAEGGAERGSAQGALEMRLREDPNWVFYGDAVIDMTLWLNAFAAVSRSLVLDLHALLADPDSGTGRVLQERNHSAARHYLIQGFFDPTLSALDSLSAPALAAYASGAASLLRLPDPSLVNKMIGLPEETRREGGGTKAEAKSSTTAGELVRRAAHLRRVERAGVRIFFDLQCRLHHALDWPAPVENEAAPSIRAIFGELPNLYLEELGGCHAGERTTARPISRNG
jgi:hypothetical protein